MIILLLHRLQLQQQRRIRARLFLSLKIEEGSGSDNGSNDEEGERRRRGLAGARKGARSGRRLGFELFRVGITDIQGNQSLNGIIGVSNILRKKKVRSLIGIIMRIVWIIDKVNLPRKEWLRRFHHSPPRLLHHH